MARILPNLQGLDKNVTTYDEKTYSLEHKSIRFCTMNSYTILEPSSTVTFVPEYGAVQHLKLLDEQVTTIRKL